MHTVIKLPGLTEEETTDNVPLWEQAVDSAWLIIKSRTVCSHVFTDAIYRIMYAIDGSARDAGTPSYRCSRATLDGVVVLTADELDLLRQLADEHVRVHIIMWGEDASSGSYHLVIDENNEPMLVRNTGRGKPRVKHKQKHVSKSISTSRKRRES